MVVMNPGVQYPHCRPWHSWNACCTGPSPPSGARQPSTVVTSAPSTVTANNRHERTGSPSSSTVHAPQTPCSHPTWVPVYPRSCRRKSDSSRRASTVAVRRIPLTVKETSGTGHRRPTGPGGEHRDEVAPVRGGGVDVVLRFDPARGQRAGRGPVRAGGRLPGDG